MTTATLARTPVRAAGGDTLAGLGALVRFALRRDRIRIPIWLGAMLLMTVATTAGFPDLYPTAVERQSRARIMESPAGLAMSGPGIGLDDYTFGAMLANEMLGFLAIFVALMTVLMVVRHSRNEEEAGRAELVRAGVVGRHAHLTAALTLAIATNLLLGALFTVALGGLGIESVSWTGSLAFGAALASVGIVFAAIAAVTAQLFEHGRTAAGMAGTAIGVAYALRAAGDMGDGTLSWLSPIGWAQQTRAYVDERWWPLAVALAVAVAGIAAAYRLGARRDVGAGLRDPRPGNAAASRYLPNTLGFAVRLHRGSLIAWTAAMFAFGAMYGSVAAQVETFIEENPAIAEVFARVGAGASLVEQWLSLVVSLLAMVAAVFAILAVVRLRGEETYGRAEPVLATALDRYRWLSGHLTVALVGGTAVLLASGLGIGLTASASTGDWSLLPGLLGAAAGYVPTVWLATGLALALFGWAPRALHLAWLVLGYGILIGMLGGLLQLPDWTFDLSPFTHVPQLPAAAMAWTPVLVLAAIAAALVAAGFAGFRRRDLETV